MNRVVVLLASAGLTLGLGVFATWQGGVVSSDSSGGVAVAPSPDESAESHPVRPHDALSTRRGGDRQFTPELVARILEVAHEVRSPMADHLQNLCDHDPREFERVMRTTTNGRHLLALADLKERDPQLYEFKMGELQTEAEIAELARQIAEARRSGDSDRERVLQVRIETTAQMHVAFSLASRGVYLNRLQEHIDALREELQRDGNNFEATVTRRIEDAITQAEQAVEATARRE